MSAFFLLILHNDQRLPPRMVGVIAMAHDAARSCMHPLWSMARISRHFLKYYDTVCLEFSLLYVMFCYIFLSQAQQYFHINWYPSYGIAILILYLKYLLAIIHLRNLKSYKPIMAFHFLLKFDRHIT